MRATPFNLGRKTFCSVPGLEVCHEKETQQQEWNEKNGDQASPPPPSSIVHGEGRSMEPILNLEIVDLLEKNSLEALPKISPQIQELLLIPYLTLPIWSTIPLKFKFKRLT